MAIDRAFLDELRSRVDLADLIGSRMPLRRSGREYVARCPFHEEKTPSFYVNPTKQFYHCFGCGAHGDAIAFLMNYDRLSFREAVETLARQCGLELPDQPSDPKEEARRELAEKLFALNREVARLYFQKLRSEEGKLARLYLKGRGIGGEVAGRFGLGYAPPGWRFLLDRFDLDLLLQASLITQRENHCFDRFRNRLIFPIRDLRGRILGFGSRTLTDEPPKYLNSPETPIFQKRQLLYGLYELRKKQRPSEIIVVEGYFDVLTLVQAGITNVVATLGTALSEEHLKILFRHTEELIFCFDGDAAGFRAAWRALEVALPHLQDGRTIRFLLLPAGQDPDAFIRSEGVIAFHRQLKQALPFSEFFFLSLSQDLSLKTAEGRAQLVARAKPYLSKLPKGALRETMWRKLKAVLQGEERSEPLALQPIKPSLMRWWVALLLRFPKLGDLMAEGPEPLKMVVRLQREGLEGEALCERLVTLYPELGDLSAEMEAVSFDEQAAREVLQDALKKWRRRPSKRRELLTTQPEGRR